MHERRRRVPGHRAGDRGGDLRKPVGKHSVLRLCPLPRVAHKGRQSTQGSSAASTEKGSTGESAVYYADHAAELVYHVAPLMPSDGAANLHKKRLVSKDYVLVVWSEDGLYDDTALESPYNDLKIIISPPCLWPLQRPCHSQRQARGSHRSSSHRASPGHHRCRQVRPRAPCPPHGNERVPRHRGLSHRARTPLRPPPAHPRRHHPPLPLGPHTWRPFHAPVLPPLHRRKDLIQCRNASCRSFCSSHLPATAEASTATAKTTTSTSSIAAVPPAATANTTKSTPIPQRPAAAAFLPPQPPTTYEQRQQWQQQQHGSAKRGSTTCDCPYKATARTASAPAFFSPA